MPKLADQKLTRILNTLLPENHRPTVVTSTSRARRISRVTPISPGLFRDTAEGETGHAHGHMDFLKEVGDPATGEAFGNTSINLRTAIAGETYEYTEIYPGFRAFGA